MCSRDACGLRAPRKVSPSTNALYTHCAWPVLSVTSSAGYVLRDSLVDGAGREIGRTTLQARNTRGTTSRTRFMAVTSRNAVAQLHQTILETFNGVQDQGHVTVTPRDQWD